MPETLNAQLPAATRFEVACPAPVATTELKPAFVKVVAAGTPAERKEAAQAFAELATSNLTDDFIALLEKKAATNGKKEANDRVGVFACLLGLVESERAIHHPVLVSFLPIAYNAMADKIKSVCGTAKAFAVALVKHLPGHALMAAMPQIVDQGNCKWQGGVLKMAVLEAFTINAPQQVSRGLTELVPMLNSLMWHDKPEFRDAAIEAMKHASATVDNRNIDDHIQDLISSILDMSLVDELVKRLAGIVFVQEVKSEALAIMLPLLTRALATDAATPTKRQAARIIDNMSKLVEDPRECQVFLPKILPLLERCSEQTADPECREVCEKAFVQLKRAGDMKFAAAGTDYAKVLEMMTEQEDKSKNLQRVYVSHLIVSLADAQIFEEEEWNKLLSPFLDQAAIVALLAYSVSNNTVPEVKEEEDDAEELCDCDFSLAFGSKILMKKTKLKLKRGYRYGLIGKNDSGKTSLMRAIADNQIEGFPDPATVRTIFVETDVQGDDSDLTVLNYLFNHPMLKDCGVSKENMSATLISVGFGLDGPASINQEVGRLSGGWRMKLALARAMLLKADILLLDEPTNHLDPMNRAWVEDYLTGLTNVTSIMVSHDAGFLERVCNNMLHIDELKLHNHRGSLSKFVERVPEAKAFFELKSSDKYKFKFPEPGVLEGITSKGKHIMKMSNITFTYPTADKPQLVNVSVRVSLSSRVACVGPNGAGKSTMIKLLTGELVPDEGSGDVWKHPNCRVAYVAQHAFVHIENHLDKTPNEYIRWRYQYGVDKEALKKDTMILTPEEEELIKQVVVVEITDEEGNEKKEKRVIKKMTNGRRMDRKTKTHEYEVQLIGGFDTKIWLPAARLVVLGWEKHMKEVDERVAALASQYARPLTQQFIEQHIMDVGLEREFATHSTIGALSGGQKVKVVLAAALWKAPHMIILDEPTNYLDRESLGALADAIGVFEGGIVIVSHNNEFCQACCPETWVLANHTVDVQGDPEWLAQAEKEKVKDAKLDDEDLRDAFGNTVTVKSVRKATKQQMKKLRKKIEKMRKDGEEVFTDEEMEKEGYEM